MNENSYIQREVKESASTSEENRNKTQKILQETEKICSMMEQKGYKDKANTIRKECEDVRLATFGSLKEERFSTSSLLGDLRKDLRAGLDAQPIDLREGEITNEELDVIDQEFQDVKNIHRAQKQETKKTLEEVYGKESGIKLGELSPSQAKKMLSLTQENYTTFKDIDISTHLVTEVGTSEDSWLESAGNTVNQIGSWFSDSIDDDMKLSQVSSQGQYNTYQEGLIDTIYGTGTSKKGFSRESGILLGYNKEKGGNYTVKKNDFENSVKNGETIDPKSLASFINSVYDVNDNDKLGFKINISKILGNRVEDISTLLSTSNDSYVKDAKDKLVDVGIFKNNKFYDCFSESMTSLFGRLLQAGRGGYKIEDLDSYMMSYKEVSRSRPDMGERVGKDIPTAGSILHITKIRENILSSSEDTNITHLKNPELKNTILQERRRIFQEKTQQLKKEIIKNIQPIFKDAPHIQEEIHTFIDAKTNQGISVEELGDKLKRMITHFNHTHPEKAILINNKQALSLLDSVNSIKGLQLESSLSKSRAIFDTVTKEVKIGSIKLESTKKHIEELQRQRTSIMQGSMRESDFLQLKGIEEELEKYGIDKKTLENLLSSEEQRLQKISDDIQSDESHLVVVEKDSIALAEISKLYAEGISKYKSEESQAFPFEQEMPQEKEEFSEGFGNVSQSIKDFQKTDIGIEIQKKFETKIQDIQDQSDTRKKLIKNKDWDSLTTLAEKEIQKNNKKYESPNWDKQIIAARASYETAMVENYGENWEEQVPLAPKSLEQKKNNSGEEILSKYSGEQTEITIYNESPAILSPTGEYISITPEEQELIEKNPEVGKNIIKGYDFCKELNMLGVWEYRQELCIAMNDMNINIYDDSLREEELLKFGNNVAKIINGLQDEVVLSTDSPSQELLTSELRNFSESGNLNSQDKTFNSLGEDKFTALLREKSIIGGTIFQTSIIKQALSV